MSISERIKALSEFAGSQTKLANKAGVHNAVISRIINVNTTTIRSDTLEALTKVYPNLNARWLLTGKGKMWLDQSEVAVLQEPDYASQYETVQEQMEKRIEALDRLTLMQDQRIADLERAIRHECPELAKKLGLSEE